MRIYIRHGHKAYRNGNPSISKNQVDLSYAHDPPLTIEGKREAFLLAQELLKKYPIPKQIITSPYLRARETADIMASAINKDLPVDIEILFEKEISEYLGNHTNSHLDVTPRTFQYNPPHPETFDQFKKRIKRYSNNWQKSEDVIWLITHGIVINEIIRPFYCRKKIPYLGYIVSESPDQPPQLFFSPDMSQ